VYGDFLDTLCIKCCTLSENGLHGRFPKNNVYIPIIPTYANHTTKKQSEMYGIYSSVAKYLTNVCA